MMMIDEVFPHVVGDRGALKDQLLQRAREQGLSVEQATEPFAAIPAPLIDAGAFLDKLTGLWRYEFGVPFEIDRTLVWGAHMWVPVDHLHRAIVTANARLSEQERAAYYARLNDPERHAVTLAEMIPGSKVQPDLAAQFEVRGLGAGNSTVDWVVHAPDRRVMLDVKSRSKDFIEQMSRDDGSKVMPKPEHDPALLFRSHDGKFLPANPDEQLQGVWIATHIQQNEDGLSKAFAALDTEKVHFAILGDWEPDIHVLVRRDADREYLLELFAGTPSIHFRAAGASIGRQHNNEQRRQFMATLPPSASPFDPVLEIENGTLDGKPCVNAYYVAISEASYEVNDSGPGATRDKVLLATVSEDALRMFPINVRRGVVDYLKPRHDSLRTITIERDDYAWPLPSEPGDFEELLLGLPTGFSKQFQYGLGLKWEYRFFVNAVDDIPGITELVISTGAETTVAPPTYRLGVKRFEQLRRAIDNIARRYQREALEDKLLVAYTNLLHVVVPADFPLRTKKIRPGAIYELVKIAGERSNLSRSDRQAAMSIITMDKEEIAKTDADALLALRSDIEKVTLGTLIQKFEEMLAKNLTEPKWQEFLKTNPFILSLAFAYPVFLVQDQAYVGGATIRGAGEKIADFLLAQRYTGNLALIEIKRPNTPLLKTLPYRADLHAPTTEVSGSISQVLDQKYRLQNSFTQKAYESGLTNVHPYSIQCIVIVGTAPTSKDERKSLELFRNSTKDVAIVTFDELLEKLKEIQRVFSAADEPAPPMLESNLPF